MTDIVYLLGGGSRWGNNEIKFSLRSVEKHLTGVGRVFTLGHTADLLKDTVHISIADLPNENYNKARNIKNKVLTACNTPEISDPFLLFSDDYFLNASFAADAYPSFHREKDLQYWMDCQHRKAPYWRVYFQTIEALKKNNLPIKHFNNHAPILIDKEKLKRAVEICDWGVDLGCMLKSIYANYSGVTGTVQEDCKIAGHMTKEGLQNEVSGKPFFTVSDGAVFVKGKVYEPMNSFLNELYPNKSRWEK